MKIIGIFSLKGGVGKTTVALNIAACLREFGKSVLIADFDVNNTIAISLGYYQNLLTYNDVINGIKTINEVVYKSPFGIEFISFGNATINRENLQYLFFLSPREFIIIDSLPTLNEYLFSICDEIYLITTQELNSVNALMNLISFLKEKKIKVNGIIVNKYDKRKPIKINEIHEVCGLPIVLVLPNENKIEESFYSGVPFVYLYPNSKFSKEIRKFVAGLIGFEYKEKNVFSNIFLTIKSFFKL